MLTALLVCRGKLFRWQPKTMIGLHRVGLQFAHPLRVVSKRAAHSILFFPPLRQSLEGFRKTHQRGDGGFGANGFGQLAIFGCLFAKLDC